MNDAPGNNGTNGNGQQQTAALDELGVLRQLLVGEEQQQLAGLQRRLEDPGQQAEAVSQVLPEAVSIRSARDSKLARALAPTIEEAFQASIKKNPRALVDVISPIMGPAIRLSIFQAIAAMVQSLNQAMEHSISPRGLKWRWESLRTGVPFPEVVLLHTLVYQVEQVFLIHKETGLLLQHVGASVAENADADMVSGMLTAIQDFVRDSFGGGSEEQLHTMQVGERSVWVEQGPHAVIAGVLRGTAPQDVRALFQEALENIHMEQKDALEEYAGDAAPFEMSWPHLEECLKSQFQSGDKGEKKEESPGRSPLFWIVPAVVVTAILGAWITLDIREGRRWSAYVDALKAAPGIVVTDVVEKDGRVLVSGLLDPLAQKPELLPPEVEFFAMAVIEAWEPYQSFHRDFLLSRIRQLLKPPPLVQLDVEEGVLIATGSAPHQWIAEARYLTRAVSGIAGYDDSELVDNDWKLVQARIKAVADILFYFQPSSATINVAHAPKLNYVAEAADRLYDAVRSIDLGVEIRVIGHADGFGSDDNNRILSRQRADGVRDGLSQRVLTPVRLTAEGAGADQPLQVGDADAETGVNRRVSFSVHLTKADGSKLP